MGEAYEHRKALYTSIIDGVIDRAGDTITDRAGQEISRRWVTGATGVYDKIPQGTDGGAASAYPCVVIGLRVANEYDTDDTVGRSTLTRIHSYSRSGSSKEIEDMQDAIYSALHSRDIFMEGYNPILLYRESSDIMESPNGSFVGICEYRTLTVQP